MILVKPTLYDSNWFYRGQEDEEAGVNKGEEDAESETEPGQEEDKDESKSKL